MVITIDYLASWWKQNSLWNCDNLRSGQGPSCNPESAKMCVCVGGGGGGGGISPTFARFVKKKNYAFERTLLK